MEGHGGRWWGSQLICWNWCTKRPLIDVDYLRPRFPTIIQSCTWKRCKNHRDNIETMHHGNWRWSKQTLKVLHFRNKRTKKNMYVEQQRDSVVSAEILSRKLRCLLFTTEIYIKCFYYILLYIIISANGWVIYPKLKKVYLTIVIHICMNIKT